MEHVPALIVPVHGPASLAAAVRYGADGVSFRGWPAGTPESARMSTGGGLPAFRAEDLADIVDFCNSRHVTTRVEIDSALTGAGVNAAIELVAGFIEIGVRSFVVSDSGLAVSLREFLPDAELIAGQGLPIANLATAAHVRDMGFTGFIASSTTPLGVLAEARRETGLKVEVTVFGARPAAWCNACMLGQYLESRPCEGPTFGTCRRRFDAVPGTVGLSSRAADAVRENPESRWLDMRFFSGLSAIPALLDAGVDAINVGPDSRSSGSVRMVTRVFRSALDAASAAAFGESDPFRLQTEWLVALQRASMHDDVTPGFFGDVSSWRGSEPGSLFYRAARALEPVIRGIEADADGRGF